MAQVIPPAMQTTRRTFLSAMIAGAFDLHRRNLPPIRTEEKGAEVKLRISNVKLEIAPGHTITTTAYNGGSAEPIRLRQDILTSVVISNDTEDEEYVHWHGLLLPSELDGTAEEGSLSVSPGKQLRYSLKPAPSGSRFVHSHAMAMNDLSRGAYSGQFAPVYIEPRNNRGAYDQEIFLTTHEWEPHLATEEEEEALNESALHQIMAEGRDSASNSANREVIYKIASINGKALGHGEPIRVKFGQRILIHVINASATESIRLALPSHSFWVTALDGNAVPEPHSVDVIELGASERVDAVVLMNQPGIWILGEIDPQVREKGLGIVVEYAGQSGRPTWHEARESTWDYSLFGKKREERKLAESIPMVITRGASDENGMERWAINGRSYNPTDKPEALRRNHRYRFVFENRTEEDHPLHLHRARFELTDVQGKSTAGLMKDVVVVKGYQSVEVDFVPEQMGPLLFHCHQQMHMDAGFKKLFTVIPS